MSAFVVAALYHFHPVEQLEVVKQELQTLCENESVMGTLLLATEGINGTVAGPREGIDALLTYLHAHPSFAELIHKESFADEQPFDKMKVKIKRDCHLWDRRCRTGEMCWNLCSPCGVECVDL